MASVFPGALDTLPTTHVGGDVIASADINNLGSAANNIEAELGINPSGSAATVAARFTAVESAAVGTALLYVTKSASFTIAAVDAGKMIEIASASAVTISIPTDAAGSMPTTGVWMFRREGTALNTAGSVNFVVVDNATTTLRSPQGLVVIARQYDVVTLEKRAVNDYRLYGNLA